MLIRELSSNYQADSCELEQRIVEGLQPWERITGVLLASRGTDTRVLGTLLREHNTQHLLR